MQTDNFNQASKRLKGGLVKKLINLNAGKGIQDANSSKIITTEDSN